MPLLLYIVRRLSYPDCCYGWQIACSAARLHVHTKICLPYHCCTHANAIAIAPSSAVNMLCSSLWAIVIDTINGVSCWACRSLESLLPRLLVHPFLRLILHLRGPEVLGMPRRPSDAFGTSSIVILAFHEGIA